jgi:hypothetical protein
VELVLKGKDLIKEGYKAGKDIGIILKAALKAKIEGQLSSSTDENEQRKIELQWIFDNYKK